MRSACLVMSVATLATVSCCAWAGASLYGANVARELAQRAPTRAMVETISKGDRLVPSVKSPADVSVDATFASVEVTGRLVSAITIRDQNGRVLYSADPDTRTTIIAKRPATEEWPRAAKGVETADHKQPASPSAKMPDGCEGAFSPYAAPRMKHIIGRCISEIAVDVRVASAAP
jgi:hypothetical protein